MVIKRPHILRFKTLPAAATKDADGNWIPGEVGSDIISPCRYEPNGSGKTVASNDGKSVVYSGIVYLNVNHQLIPYGTEVSVTNGELEIFHGNAINFSNGQFNSRLWV